MIRSAHMGASSTGLVWLRSDVCTCAYPDCGGYNQHEPHCGVEPVGWLPPESYDGEPDPYECIETTVLPSCLWDFSAVDYPIGGSSE